MLTDLSDDSQIHIMLDLPEAASFDGKLQRIFPALDPQSRQGTLEILPAVGQPHLRAGQFVDVEITGRMKSRLLIPFTALRTDKQGEYVYVVRDNHASHRTVVPGAHFGDQVEIVEGLSKGEVIIKRGFMNLKNGAPVTILD